MSVQVREGRFDLVLLAGPGVQRWPGLGVRALATLCSEAGLSVGLFGGEGLRVRGVLPAQGTGGVAVVEDSQGRIHRIESRAVVRICEPLELPDPFPGWSEPALLPLQSALRLRREGQTVWSPATAILGVGNMALSLGCELLESGVPEVYCLDTGGCTPGWEVYRRRFRILGGRILRASPVELRKKAPLLWELRLKDDLGVRVLEVAWVVSAGPFRPSEGIREYPPGSCLFELEQSAGMSQSEDPQGWVLEEERGRLLATRIIKALGNPMGAGADRAQGRELREHLDEVQRSARQRLKRAQRYLEAPLDWTHEGKWSTPEMLRRMKSFPGVPGREQAGRTVASIECIEEIECNLCETACPEHAITISRGSANAPSTFLNESACTGCGKCISACPARVPVMIQERESVSAVQLTIARPAGMVLREKELVQVTNRDGRTLGAAKVLAATEWLKLEMPAHLASEARGVRRSVGQLEDEWVLRAEQTAASKVEVQLQGEKRMLRMGQPLALALFETGYARGDDRLLCRDGSCRRCEIRVDGVKKLACRTQVHRGMSIQLIERPEVADAGLLCPCSGVTVAEIEQKISEGKLRSPSSIRQACRVGEGSCRGRTCMGAFRRLVEARGVAAADWIDWRFPWADWTLSV